MPARAPHICACGKVVPSGAICPCQAARTRERNARFDKTRPSSSQRGYNGSWEKARKSFLNRHPRCARCNARAEVVDHTIPHKGDQNLFWDKSNWQPLCTPCHSGAKQRDERRQYGKV